MHQKHPPANVATPALGDSDCAFSAAAETPGSRAEEIRIPKNTTPYNDNDFSDIYVSLQVSNDLCRAPGGVVQRVAPPPMLITLAEGRNKSSSASRVAWSSGVLCVILSLGAGACRAIVRA